MEIWIHNYINNILKAECNMDPCAIVFYIYILWLQGTYSSI